MRWREVVARGGDERRERVLRELSRCPLSRLAMTAIVAALMELTCSFPAQAQLRLPGLPLPALPLQSLQHGLSQPDAVPLAEFSAVRRRVIADLIRSNPRTLGRDAHGEPLVRDEILALAPADAGLAAAAALGLEVAREQSIALLEWRLVVFRAPPGVALDKTLRRLRAADPAGKYDFNHVYLGSGVGGLARSTAVRDTRARDELSRDGAAAQDDATIHAQAAVPAFRVGLIDTGIDVSHPVFKSATVQHWGCQERAVPDAHGTAVASLLVGRTPVFVGAAPQTALYAADVYCGRPTGGAVDALAAAFGWLVQNQVPVINVSLVGPDNALLANLVAALTLRGYVLVAAVGNDGPAAAPLYPASYPRVVGVTGVDARHHALLEAARGPQVMFAAPGADMAAAAPGATYVAVRGTSFAAPIVTGLLAQQMVQPDLARATMAVQALARAAVHLGNPGKDLTYGYGLVGTEFAVDLKSLIGQP